MKQAAGDLEFEEAAQLRDEIKRLEAAELELTTGLTAPQAGLRVLAGVKVKARKK